MDGVKVFRVKVFTRKNSALIYLVAYYYFSFCQGKNINVLPLVRGLMQPIRFLLIAPKRCIDLFSRFGTMA